jgi:hypothetical protein
MTEAEKFAKVFRAAADGLEPTFPSGGGWATRSYSETEVAMREVFGSIATLFEKMVEAEQLADVPPAVERSAVDVERHRGLDFFARQLREARELVEWWNAHRQEYPPAVAERNVAEVRAQYRDALGDVSRAMADNSQ